MSWDLIQPLDLILFKGTDLVSRLVETVERVGCGWGDVSHVGLVVTSELMPGVAELVPGTLYIWESTSSLVIPETGEKFVPDVERRTSRFGVQIRDLRAVVDAYTGVVYWAQLHSNPWSDPTQRPRCIAEVQKLHELYKSTHYESNPIALASSAVRYMRPLRNLIDYTLVVCHHLTNLLHLTRGPFTQLDAEELTVFCSEFVSIVLIILRVMPATQTPYDITPVNILHTLPDLIGAPVQLCPSV